MDAREKQIHKICSLLERAWLFYPDQRFMQFVLNYIGDDTSFFEEDRIVEDILNSFLEFEISRRKKD